MQPTSAEQLRATTVGGFPPPEDVREGISVVALPLNSGNPPYTLTYLILDAAGNVHVVDPGTDSDANWKALVSALARTGRKVDDVASAVVTHLHYDHLGMAARLRAASGGTVALHRAEQAAIVALREPPADDPGSTLAAWGVPEHRRGALSPTGRMPGSLLEFEADLLLEDGAVLDVPGRTLRVVHTPGHTPGSLTLHEAGEDLLFTGDHLLPVTFPGIGLGGRTAANPIRDYLGSLDRLLEYESAEVLPGHEYRFSGLRERTEETAAHHRQRTSEVAAALAADPAASIWQIAESLTWTLGWDNIPDYFRWSALAQTAMHADYLRSGGG
jgi:glyoxylase-like metal-dependent hydrolase (beta-lactamase superfamily II)